jgi:4-hydroxymandelate oxidase
VSGADGLRAVADFERRCAEILPTALYGALLGYPGDPEWTALTNNLDGFARLRLRTRVLTGAGERSLTTRLLGADAALPILTAPTGGLVAFRPESELPIVRAAGALGAVYVNPCLSTIPVDQIAVAATGPFWQQIWLFRDRGVTEFLVSRAESAGARAVVLTVSNAGAPSWSSRRLSARFAATEGSPQQASDEPASALNGYDGPRPSRRELTASIDPGIKWPDVEWLSSLTSLPVAVKGIQTAEDAALAEKHGVQAVVVSNHGGRFLQQTRGTIDAVPEVVDAVSDAVEVYVDGGVRTGPDVLAALALGARGVLVGRPVIWGVIVDGERGVRRVLELLRDDLDASMGLAGVHDVRSVPRTIVHVEGP